MKLVKIMNSAATTSLVKANNPIPNKTFHQMLTVISFSAVNHIPKNIHSNKVDAPFATTSEEAAKAQSRILEEDDKKEDKSYNRGRRKNDMEELSEFVADKAVKGTKNAVETAFIVGEKLAEGMEQTFGSIKEVTRKVKDTVVGNQTDHKDRQSQGRTRQS
ncbi:uncharacterized protein LOC130809463 [Amaranthus tricolor]|uniref:uncharacterized protein LOC130809463 n=1 Tax=Amaranthus tricolor TaxID=29722 RepID=UPI0025876B26|nr:uncharacterized protein LOC130809463 [Amaranthus tricolor]